MTINIKGFNPNSFYTGLVAPIKNAPCFRGDSASFGVSDTFTQNSELSPYLSKEAVLTMMAMNPKVRKILDTNGVKEEVNLQELKKLANGHLKETKALAAGIINNLPSDIKQGVNRQAVLQAAMFHDFGKVLIPNSIVNKQGRLNEKERAVMELHSVLGFELLKTQNISPKALELIKYHHQNKMGDGYPQNDGSFVYGIEAEIVAIADKYSALTEKRSYKPALKPEEALRIICDEMPQSPVRDALVAHIAGTLPTISAN